MPKRIVSGKDELRLSGRLDGARAMELACRLGAHDAGTVVLDFSAVDEFEPFGVEVLVRALEGQQRVGGPLLCRGVPPCLAARLGALGIATAPSPRHPRWAPW